MRIDEGNISRTAAQILAPDAPPSRKGRSSPRWADGIRVAPYRGVTKHAAAFVLLLAIAGAPATTLACIGWCALAGEPVSVSCHNHGSGAGVIVSTADDTCAGLLTTFPYLTEEIQPTGTVMPASAPYILAGAAGEAQLVSAHDAAIAVEHRATSSLVLRL